MNLGYRWFWGWLCETQFREVWFWVMVWPLSLGVGIWIGLNIIESFPPEPKVYVTEADMWQSLAGSYKRRLEKERLETLRFKRRLTRDEARIVFSHVLKEEGLDWDVEPLVEIAWRESRLYTLAQNPESSAFGLFQALDSTARAYGQKTTCPFGQTKTAVAYILARYKSPEKALAFHKREGWY